MDVKVELVPRIAADPATGKLRRVVSRVGPPDDLKHVMNGAELATA